MTPWAESLPRVKPEEAEVRRRAAAVAERLRGWGGLLSGALPAAFEGIWPFDPASGVVLRALLEEPDGERREIAYSSFPLRIGRATSCALQLPDPKVSSEHAEIQLDGGRAHLMDLRSTNGTLVNGERLRPLTPVELKAGDRVGIGPFALTSFDVSSSTTPAAAFALEATALAPVAPQAAFAGAHPSDRWLRVRWAGETALLKVTAPWMRACWRRTAEVSTSLEEDVGPMEEGAAQFVLTRAAEALSDAIAQPVELSGWLTSEEARRAVEGEHVLLGSEVWVHAGELRVPASVLVPAPEPKPSPAIDGLATLSIPASVCLGRARVSPQEWAGIEPGDALVPDEWWAGAWIGEGAGEGRCFVRTGGFWHAARLPGPGADAKLRLDALWLKTAGDGEMSDEDPPRPLEELELLVTVELERFPVTLSELERWRPGELVSLRHGPGDPVKLVVETGAERRVLAEGRVVVVGDRLGVEIVRVLSPAAKAQDT